MQNKKDKYIAALLAFVGGIFGVHRFYLNQRGLAFLMIGITLVTLGILSAIISFIDALLFLAMSSDQFDKKYNAVYYEEKNQKFSYKSYNPSGQRGGENQKKQKSREILKKINHYRNSGIEHFRLYDFEESIEDFKKVLELDPYNVAANFNIACAYSQIEKPNKSMRHISRAVRAGYDDFEKIRNHEKLSFVRIQPEWEDFEKNGFLFDVDDYGWGTEREGEEELGVKEKTEKQENENLLESLKKLHDQRERGGITEEEFQLERRKLMSS